MLTLSQNSLRIQCRIEVLSELSASASAKQPSCVLCCLNHLTILRRPTSLRTCYKCDTYGSMNRTRQTGNKLTLLLVHLRFSTRVTCLGSWLSSIQYLQRTRLLWERHIVCATDRRFGLICVFLSGERECVEVAYGAD